MEPRSERITDLAIYDPVAAYGLLRGSPRIPISFNAVATFSSVAVPQNPIVGALDTTIAQRTWIDHVDYDIQVPNAFANSVFKTLWDANLRKAPGISVQITVFGGPRYVVSPQFTPLNNFALELKQRWPGGWPLYKQQSINVVFSMQQTPGGIASPNLPPVIVTMTFNGWQFLDWNIDEVSVDDARAELTKAGFVLPAKVGYVIPST